MERKQWYVSLISKVIQRCAALLFGKFKRNASDLAPSFHCVLPLQGGAISYAAAVASAYGIHACVVTAAGPDADLSVFDNHELHVVHANNTLTFEHSYTWWGECSPF